MAIIILDFESIEGNDDFVELCDTVSSRIVVNGFKSTDMMVCW